MNQKSKSSNPLKVLGVYAHPDDESFCVGGTLAKYAAMGAETMVVSFTQGEAGQIHDTQVATRQTLGQTRANELVEACKLLGVRHVRCFDYGDGRLSDVPFEQLIAKVTYIIREFQPDIVLTFGEDGAYGHPDHIVIGAATNEAFQLAGNPAYCSDQLQNGLPLHTPSHLYHSYFPRQNELLLKHLAGWLENMSGERFHGQADYLRGLRIFSKSLSMLGYANDHVEIEWFPAGFSIVEQGEAASSLYLILSGSADVMQEDENGQLVKIAQLDAGQFFGETGVATAQPRNAYIVAREGLSCLIFSPQKEANFAGRGQAATLKFEAPEETGLASQAQTLVVDTTEFVMDKVAAIAAHRTQCPISPDMFPKNIWHRLFGKEYFVCHFSTQRKYAKNAFDSFLQPLPA
ncbi:MAG: PIG-L family deacetylase [Chloroflexota bacterium]